MAHAKFEIVQEDDDIVFIRDIGGRHNMSITNDAEYVYAHINRGPSWKQQGERRIVYQDSMGEWTEIIYVPGNEVGHWRVAFKPWHGRVWDVLSH